MSDNCDTIVAIILAMHSLGMDVFLSPEFKNEDVNAIIERVDRALRTGEIYLGNTTAEEALAVAHYADEETEEAAAITQNTDNQETGEIHLAENYVSEEAQLEAYVAEEDALLNYDVARGEAVEAELRLEELTLRCLTPEYMTSHYFERCACEGKYGLDDDGEVAYHDADCPWRW